MFVKPIAGRLVPMPGNPDEYLSAAGRQVEYEQYWQKRIDAGDVTSVERPDTAPAYIPALPPILRNGVVELGDSLTAMGTNEVSAAAASALTLRQNITTRSIFSRINFMLGSPFVLLGNKGNSGETSAQMRQRFDADVSPLRPARVVLICGTNDFDVGPPCRLAKDVFADVVAIWEKCQRIGAELDVFSMTAMARYLASQPPHPLWERAKFLKMLRAAPNLYKGFGFCDLFSAGVDYTGTASKVAFGAPLAADLVSGDLTHPSSQHITKIAARGLAYYRARGFGVEGIADTQSSWTYLTGASGLRQGDSENIIRNSLMYADLAHTGGIAGAVVGGGYSPNVQARPGDIADNFRVTANFGQQAVECTLIDSPTGVGKSQHFVIRQGDSVAPTALEYSGYNFDDRAYLNPAKKYIFRGYVKAVAEVGSIHTLGVALRLIGADPDYNLLNRIVINLSNNDPQESIHAASFEGVLQSVPFTVPVGTKFFVPVLSMRGTPGSTVQVDTSGWEVTPIDI